MDELMQEMWVGLEAVHVGEQREVPWARHGGLVAAGFIVLSLEAGT